VRRITDATLAVILFWDIRRLRLVFMLVQLARRVLETVVHEGPDLPRDLVVVLLVVLVAELFRV
jgi:hypothetical protein